MIVVETVDGKKFGHEGINVQALPNGGLLFIVEASSVVSMQPNVKTGQMEGSQNAKIHATYNLNHILRWYGAEEPAPPLEVA